MESNDKLSKISLAISVVLLICVVILFLRTPGGGSADTDGSDSTEEFQPIVSTGGMTIGFYHLDSINERAAIMKEIQDSAAIVQTQFDEKVARHQRRVEAFQKKWGSKGPLLSSEQAQYESEAISIQQAEMELNQEMQMTLPAIQQELLFIAMQRVSDGAAILGEQEGFDMIFAYQIGQNPTYIAPKYDVTSRLLKVLDEEYYRSSTTTGGTMGQ